MEIKDLHKGDEVNIAYTGYCVRAKVIEVEPFGNYGKQLGWVLVEQITDYEEASRRPQYEAAAEFITPLGEPIAESPLAYLARRLGNFRTNAVQR